jgi:hypothetical protein
MTVSCTAHDFLLLLVNKLWSGLLINSLGADRNGSPDDD